MSEELDWRLTWEADWMFGTKLERRRFTAPTPDWDHEHCVLCRATFTETPHEGTLQEGLVHGYDPDRGMTAAEQRTVRHDDFTAVKLPTSEQWICEGCFEDFKQRFGWSVAEPGPGFL